MHLLEEGTGLSLLSIDELASIALELQIPVFSYLVLNSSCPISGHLSIPLKTILVTVVLLNLVQLLI